MQASSTAIGAIVIGVCVHTMTGARSRLAMRETPLVSIVQAK